LNPFTRWNHGQRFVSATKNPPLPLFSGDRRADAETIGGAGAVVVLMSALLTLPIREFRLPSAVQPAAAEKARPVSGTDNFERIVDEYQRRLYGFALRMTGNREDAEEIVQDAFVRAYRAIGKMTLQQRTELRLQPWLYTITLNVTRNRLRSKRPTNVALDALADPDALLNDTAMLPDRPEEIVERGADMALVEQALLQLPMHLRAAATLRFIEGRSHPEIAEILQQPIGTVKSHVHRAVRILRRILGPQLGRIITEGDSDSALQ